MRQELPALIELVMDAAPPEPEPDEEIDEDEEAEEIQASPDPNKRRLQLTTNTIAAKLGAKTGSDLALAACAHLSLVKGVDSFQRKHILAEMKLATNFYKNTFGKNLSGCLKTLVNRSKILETTENTYALENKEKTRLEQPLNGS